MKERFMKNGVFSLEYDKETLKDMVLTLQQENKILKENAENNDKVADKVNWENQLLKKENEQLKHNWDLLKICLKDVMDSYDEDNKEDKDFIREILDMMQELEQGGNVDERRRKRSNKRASL